MFLTGISTRTLSMISNRLIGRKISPTEVSNANKELIDAVENWRTRDLSEEKIKYIFLDGVNFDMRNKPLKTFSANNPCIHWLLRPKKFKKKHFPSL
ncbi:MAG: transposase [Thermodesulfobacteriota bacterium]|nr:transposase [Thermodesulfobacteriota bacterium]